MGKIYIDGMEFFGKHGCFEEEKILGNHFEVDICVEYDFSEMKNSDSIKNTLNYQTLYKVVKTEMEIASQTIEHVAYRILDSIYNNFDDIIKVKLKVSKMSPMLLSGGKVNKVSVELER